MPSTPSDAELTSDRRGIDGARRRRAAARLLRPALHRHRRVRRHRQAQAVVHDQWRSSSLSASPASLIRGFTFGIDFEGGTKVSLPVAGAHGTATRNRSRTSSPRRLARPPSRSQTVGSGRFGDGADPLRDAVERRRSTSCAPRCSTRSSRRAKTANPASWRSAIPGCRRRWGGQITQKALIALVVFLVLAAIYIAVRYERYMAVAALAALVFDHRQHRRRLLAGRVRGHPGDRDRSADDSGLLALRHRHRVRQGRGEHPRLRAHHPADVRRTGQPGDQPDLHAVDQHQPDLGAADPAR